MYMAAFCCPECQQTGGQCGGSMSYATGLGFIDPISLTVEITTVIQQVKAFWDQLQAALGIGAGRREADVITPLVDKITQTILAPAVNMAENPTQFTCQDFLNMQTAGNNAFHALITFLTNTQWQDGRAAQKTLYWALGPAHPINATLTAEVGQPYGYIIWHAFTTKDVPLKCGTTVGGGPGVISIGGFSLGLPAIALGLAGLYFAFGRKGRSA